MNNWRVWIHSIVAASIGGAASAVPAALTSPDRFNLSNHGMQELAKVAVIGAITGVCLMLKQSPLAASKVVEKTVKETTTQVTKED
jgi:hypothetical protein